MIHWNNIDNEFMIKQDKMFTISRNGDFIDIFWKKNGKQMRVSVFEKHLIKLLAMPERDAKCDALISFDEKLDATTGGSNVNINLIISSDLDTEKTKRIINNSLEKRE
jgi:hypothetical protein